MIPTLMTPRQEKLPKTKKWKTKTKQNMTSSAGKASVTLPMDSKCLSCKDLPRRDQRSLVIGYGEGRLPVMVNGLTMASGCCKITGDWRLESLKEEWPDVSVGRGTKLQFPIYTVLIAAGQRQWTAELRLVVSSD